MFHTPAHKQVARKVIATESCPECGGYTELDEEGRPYTCYFCCDTGVVAKAVADAYYQARADFIERFDPTRLGICIRMDVSEYDDISDEEAAAERTPGHRLFTRLIPVVRRPAAQLSLLTTEREFDDIPF